MIIKIEDKIVTNCTEFASACADTNKYYASRGQANLEKIKNDIFVGKLGEWACHKMLNDKGIIVAPPDMEIYKGGRKSHSADLFNDFHQFSIKTQTLQSVERYGMSWLMEKSALPKFTGHKVILCLYLGDNKVLIQNIVPFEDMLAVQAEPRLSYLKTKCAFYYDDIITQSILKVTK